jgi:hypothetical protein
MAMTRSAAVKLCEQGHIEILQKGAVVKILPPDGSFRGPIRLRAKPELVDAEVT